MTPGPASATGRQRAPEEAPDSTGYAPISSYGAIGDQRTVALVGMSGSVDWCCFPRFDSPSVFGALLDRERGGRFRIAPTGPFESAQWYLPGTNVLVTQFSTGDGAAEITDFMPVLPPDPHSRRYHEIHRRIECIEGGIDLEILFEPRFDYGAADVRLLPRRHGVLATDGQDEALALSAVPDVWWHVDADGARVTASLRLEAGDASWMVLRYDDDEVRPIERYDSPAKLKETIQFWSAWSAGLQYDGPYRETVERSALALKLLFYAPTGAVVAAPTTSLPEKIGGVRNWDYRYTWLRDASYTLYALLVLGQHDEARQFMNFLKRVARKSDGHLQIMFGIGGERDLSERTLAHLEGYRGSAPVRVGNGAFDQLQLDVYGEVMETAYLWVQHNPMSEGLWALLRRIADWVADHWTQKDHSLWEVRAGLQHYTFSKVMCWVALDRAVRMAEDLELEADVPRWACERDRIHADVMEKGWNEQKGAFVQHYDTTSLDASNLLLPVVRFLPKDDPRVKRSLESHLEELSANEQDLVFRYLNPDGLPDREGVFSLCTFWLADALILTGQRERGETIFRHMIGRANHLGLHSEEIDPDTGEFLGNFPQAFTHIAIIVTAHLLEWTRSREE